MTRRHTPTRRPRVPPDARPRTGPFARLARPVAVWAALAAAPFGGVVLTAKGAVAQGAGSAASTLLRLAPGPRPLALGGALVAASDPWALEFNPAALNGDGAVAASYQGLPVDASAAAAVATFRAGPVALGGSLRFLDYGSIEVVEPGAGGPVGVPTGEQATGGEISALVAAALRVGPVRLGLAGRWLGLDVAGLTDNAVSADAGAVADVGAGVSLGAAIQNLGGDLEAGRAAPLPRTLRAGAHVRRTLAGLHTVWTAEIRRREERTGAGFGLELGAGGERLEAVGRLGYETRPESGDAFAPLVFGAGIRVDRLTVDFAYRALGPLGATRQVGLGYRF